MYRLTIFSIQLIILIIVLTLIFNNPFIISLDIKNFKYSFTSNFFAIILIVFLLILYLTFYIFFKSKFMLNNYLLKNKYKKVEKGYKFFVEAMIAISNKDNRSAVKYHKKMNNYLSNEPSLSLLLKSEVYKIERKFSELSQVYETMLKSKKTESLGYRGLMEQNLKSQDYHHAFLYGEKLFNLNPGIDKLYETLTYISAKTKNWNQLILITDKAYSKKIISRETLNENKSIGYFEIANIKADSNIKEATKNIIKALELRKNFPPFINLHLQLVSASNNLALLKRLIRKYWYASPNFINRAIITQIIIKNNLSNLAFINQVIKNNKDNEESKKLLVFFAVKNQEWTIARNNIIGMIGENPSTEICLLMADIEIGENNDKQKSDSWKMRSENSINENTWVCKITNQSQDNWSSLSDSGYFNSLVLNNLKMLNNNN